MDSIRKRVLSFAAAAAVLVGGSGLFPENTGFLPDVSVKASALGSINARSTLSGNDLKVYDQLKGYIEQVASGSLSSTVFNIDLSALSVSQTLWTATDLGVSAIVEDGSITDAAVEAAYSKYNLNFDKVTKALLADLPFDLYWYDKSTGGSEENYSFGASNSGDGWKIDFSSADTWLTYTMYVASDYSTTHGYIKTTTVNSSKVTAAKSAKANADAIVAANAGKTDIEKMRAYLERICDDVSYNSTAANGGAAYGDPWQAVYVFDGSTSTNVVCEGYSKAFKYLCDESGIPCILATGEMSGGTGAGGHMWNIVQVEGKSVLVDVTNCDTGSVGEPDKLFLAYAPRVGDSFTFTPNSSTISYTYDSDTTSLFSSGVLTLTELPQYYSITVDDSITNGTVTASATSAEAGSTVTLTVTPDSGYTAGTVKYGDTVITPEGGVYSFTMPSENVTVTAEFEEAVDPASLAMQLTILDGSSIGVKFLVTLAGGENASDFTISVKGTEKALTALETEAGAYVYKLPVAAKEMRDSIAVVIKKNSTEVKSVTTSVYDYADTVLKDSGFSAYHTIIRAMLNYGAYSQKYFSYNTSNLANAGYENAVDSVSIPSKTFDKAALNEFLASDDAPVTYYAMNLTLESETVFTLHFNVKAGKTMDEALTYLNSFTRSGTNTVEAKNGRATIRFREIPASGLLQNFTISKGGNSFTASVDMYMTSVLSGGSDAIKPLCKSLYAFYQAAKAL